MVETKNVTEILENVVDNVDLKSRVEIEKSDNDLESSNEENHTTLIVEKNLVKDSPLHKASVSKADNQNEFIEPGYAEQKVSNTF